MNSKLFAIMFFVGVLLLVVFLGPTSFGAFIDPSSMLLVILLVYFSLAIGFGFNAPFKMIKTLSSSANCIEDTIKAKYICKCGTLISVGIGFIGTFIGIIQMLQDLKDPHVMGVGLATALITPLYGLIMTVGFFVPLYFHFNSIIEVDSK